ncbi:hypothetical protein DAMA08_041230 [Martiniozyma asiatica (nom. inval.)]|nr:hypothetical protein DAMA08_041230 [Martiniozyma asiatica]
MVAHPFDQISDAEHAICTKLIKDKYPSDKPHFSQVDRLDPPKKEMIKYLAAERQGVAPQLIPRRAYAYFYIGEDFHKALINLTFKHVICDETLPEGVHGPIIGDDIHAVEILALEHPVCKAEIEKLCLPEDIHVVCDPWMYGTDAPNQKRSLIQCYMYLANKNHTESNHYSLPLKFSPVFDGLTKEFVRMDYLPSGADETVINETYAWDEFPLVEYHPDLNGATKIREVKPLIVSQPEGVSFDIDGHKISWQDWEFFVVPNAREGAVLYDIHFKGRSVAYRLSLSEMTVPYGDPRAPFHRKQAFDLGDCGFGVNANVLDLGCECLGVIKYMDNRAVNSKGESILIPSAVCLHEQDAGILYKHVNYRTGAKVVARRREFVVQFIATVANYEYAVQFIFDQVGEIKISVRATGILSTMPIDRDVDVNYGTLVGPRVMAAYHQHMLSFRLDPAVDGHNNTVVYDDVLRMEENTELNPYNVGFYSERHYVEKAGHIDQSPFTNRAYKVINENVINPTSKKPVGYKIVMPARQMIMGSVNSYNTKRAKFATEQVWVTKYEEDRLYAAGEFTNQSQMDTGIAEWANGVDNVRDTDNIVWMTLGFTHVPKPEDFPVMPVEMHEIGLTPFGFFEKNPALDLPQASNAHNKSVYYEDNEKSTKASVSSTCCKKSAL